MGNLTVAVYSIYFIISHLPYSSDDVHAYSHVRNDVRAYGRLGRVRAYDHACDRVRACVHRDHVLAPCKDGFVVRHILYVIQTMENA